ncbi:hypothetical protein NRY95_02210 [Xanthomonas campestris pv. phormiicola]|nr:hypothetical protein [Xanthomonas campestris pv. phormiicola]UYC16820.1 hypothetical protein NRY95_02210 [Xanthomonas campestris pv. phormiicola]
MDTDSALKIITALAAGVDPFTGEVFPSDSALQHPDAVRALYTASLALQGSKDKRAKKSTARNTDRPGNVGAPWSEAEDRQLVEQFEAGKTARELAESHERTVGAIRSRLIRLGKLPAEAARS